MSVTSVSFYLFRVCVWIILFHTFLSFLHAALVQEKSTMMMMMMMITDDKVTYRLL